jgi:hypothetical protein
MMTATDEVPVPVPPNRYLVGSQGGALVFALSPRPMSPRHAVELAAWLVALAEVVAPDTDWDHGFRTALAAVRSS